MTDIRRVETLMRGHEAYPFVNPNKWSGGQYRGPYLMSANRLHGDSFPFWFQAAQAAPYPINTWWPVLVPWFIVTAEEDPSNPYATNNTATNVRVQVRNQKLYIRRSSWSLVQTLASPPSDLFAYDLSSFSSFGGYRDESADGGGNSVMVQSGGTIVPHGYGTPFNVPNPQEVTGIAVEIESRLVLNNPAGTDDRAAARYLISIACDLYPENFSSLPAVGWWPAVGAAGFARVTTGWQKMGFNTYFSAARPDMDVDALRSAYSSTLILADAPSGWTDGGGGVVIPPPTPLPTNAQRLLFIGDAYVSGNESVANSWRTWRGKTLQDLTAAGLPVDAIGREVSASSLRPTDPEHDGYSGAYISTTTNSIADRLDAILTNAGGVTYSSGGVPGPGDVIVIDARGVAAAVLMLGLTDYESAPTGIADRYSALFADVRSGLPAADLVVVTLPPRQGLTEAATNAAYPGYAALNTRIRQIAADTYGVTLADAAATALVPADYQGAALLLQSGADKVGVIIATALRSALAAGTGYIIPGAPTKPTVSLTTVSSKLHVFKWGTTPAAPAIVTGALTGGQVGQPYLVDLEITGDPAPTVTVDPSPPFAGVALSGKRISGTPTTAGAYTFTVSAASSSGPTATQTYSVVVAIATNITTTTLASVATGQAFALGLLADGAGPFTWALTDRGTLPTSVALLGNTLSGQVATAGTYTFTVGVVGSAGSDTQALSLVVVAASSLPAITTTAFPSGTVGTVYLAEIAATGTQPITYGAASLPAGLVLVAGTKNLVPNPLATGLVAGSPGTLPTEWFEGGSATGLTRTIAATTVDGRPGISVRYQGTAVAGSLGLVYAVNMPLLPSTQYTASVTWRLAAGSWASVINQALIGDESNSGGTYITSSSVAVAAPTATAARVSHPKTTAGTAASGNNYLLLDIASGAVDFTLEIGSPQFELGSAATFFADKRYAYISGTPTAPGFYVLAATATNSLGTDAAALALSVNPAAVVSAAQSGGWGKFIRQ